MINFDELESMTSLINVLTEMIPDGTKQELEVDGTKISLIKKDGTIKINTETKFDDSKTKELVKAYKENIKLVDDDMFVEISEELENQINLKEFDNLLNLKSFTSEQSSKVCDMISIACDITRNYLEHKIENLVKLCNKF